MSRRKKQEANLLPTNMLAYDCFYTNATKYKAHLVSISWAKVPPNSPHSAFITMPIVTTETFTDWVSLFHSYPTALP